MLARVLRPEPPLVLLALGVDARGAARGTPDREVQLRSLLAPLGVAVETLRLAAPAAGPSRSEAGSNRWNGWDRALEAAGAVVLDSSVLGALPEAGVAELERCVSSGLSLLVLLSPEAAPAGNLGRLIGAEPVAGQPRGEWFAKVRPLEGDGLTERVRREFPLVDRPVILDTRSEATMPLVDVSLALRDRPVICARRLGAGRVVVSGLGNEPEALEQPELATILRRSLLPARDLAHRSRRVGLAVLGYGPHGGMGLYHGLAANATAGLEMIAACDADPARRRAAEHEFPGVRSFRGVAELVADDDVEVVVVATPPSSHFELARALLEAGRHVCLEKPMCLTVAEADELISRSEAAGLALTVHQSRRYDPDFVALERAVGAGEIGELFNVETFVGGFEHPCRAWHSDVSVSGGAVYDWGSHHLDWILQLMGELPERLVAHGHKRVWHDVTNLDQVRVRLTWPDGREAEFLQSDLAGIRPPKFYLQGTRGTIAGHYRPIRKERVDPGIGYVGTQLHHAEAPVELTLARYEPGYGLTETRLPPAAPDPYAFHRNLADHLLLGEPLAVTARSARDVVVLLEAAQRSTDNGNAPVLVAPPAA